MNDFERIRLLKNDLDELIEDLEGREIQYKGNYGTVLSINLNHQIAIIYLEDSFGKCWEEELTWWELALNAKC